MTQADGKTRPEADWPRVFGLLPTPLGRARHNLLLAVHLLLMTQEAEEHWVSSSRSTVLDMARPYPISSHRPNRLFPGLSCCQGHALPTDSPGLGIGPGPPNQDVVESRSHRALDPHVDVRVITNTPISPARGRRGQKHDHGGSNAIRSLLFPSSRFFPRRSGRRYAPGCHGHKVLVTFNGQPGDHTGLSPEDAFFHAVYAYLVLRILSIPPRLRRC